MATSNRNYPLPEPERLVSEDVARLILATEMIDADIASILISLAGKAAGDHAHTISDIADLASILAGKADASHNHALASLSDVSGWSAAPDGFLLGKQGGQAIPISPTTILAAHTHAIGDVVGLSEQLSIRLTAQAVAAATAKGAPVDTDTFPLSDSEASGALKRLSWANFKAAIRAVLDPIYVAAGFGVRTGTLFDFAGPAAPEGYLLCGGQAVSRTTFAALFSVIGTAYGVGDGSTTFNLPDFRDRVAIGKGDMGGSEASRVSVTLSGERASTGNAVVSGLVSTAGLAVGMRAIGAGIGAGAVIVSIDSGTQVTLSANNSVTGTGLIRFAVLDTLTIGASGGAATHQLTLGQMPAHTHGVPAIIERTLAGAGDETVAEDGAGSSITTASAGGGQHHPQIPPALVVNKIIKT